MLPLASKKKSEWNCKECHKKSTEWMVINTWNCDSSKVKKSQESQQKTENETFFLLSELRSVTELARDSIIYFDLHKFSIWQSGVCSPKRYLSVAWWKLLMLSWNMSEISPMSFASLINESTKQCNPHDGMSTDFRLEYLEIFPRS